MAVIPSAYALDPIPRGPADIFLNVAAPAGDTEVVMAYDATTGRHTPDGTSNPSGLHLGLIREGVEVSISSGTAQFRAHQLTSPYRELINDEKATITAKGALQAGGDYTMAAQLLRGSVLTTPASKKKIKGGGLRTVTYFTVMVVWARPEAPTKYDYLLLYRANNSSGLTFTLDDQSDGAADLAFEGFSDVTRAQGDQLYQRVMST